LVIQPRAGSQEGDDGKKKSKMTITKRVTDLSKTVLKNSKTLDSLAALPKEVADQSKLLQRLLEKMDKNTIEQEVEVESHSQNEDDEDPVATFLASVENKSVKDGEQISLMLLKHPFQ